MNAFTISTFINRPLQEVIDFAINTAKAAQWQNGTESGKWSSGVSVGVGSILNTTGRLLGREISMGAEITTHHVGSEIKKRPDEIQKHEQGWVKDGGTLMTQIIQAKISGFFKMAEGSVVKQLQKQLEISGKALKTLLEAK